MNRTLARFARRLFFAAVTAALLWPSALGLARDQAQERPEGPDEALLASFTYRNLGPFRAGSWITDLAVPERPLREHLYALYVATRNGGLWKTTNGGTTFDPVFEHQRVSSIGAVAVAPSDPAIVWIGTGEAFNARSSYSGDGVYKSTDGGRTWTHLGLADTHHIARIVIHPTDPDVVYVAAMGHLYSRNAERGVFKTADGGRTWRKVLYVDDRTGAIDLVMVRRDPDTLYAAMYDKERFPWHLEEGGPGSGLYKTTDGGRRWTRLAGGLPGGTIGRIGVDVFQRRPSIVYAVVENLNPRPPTDKEADADRARGLEPQPRTVGNEVYRSDDGGRTWVKMNRPEDNVGGKALYSFNRIRVHPADDRRIYVTSDTLPHSLDGGRTWRDLRWPPTLFPKMFGDVRTMWIDPQDPDRIMLGTDGGVHVSYDGGRTSDHFANLPLGEVYAVGVDMEDPYRIYAGLQDHEMWRGPSNGWSGRVTLENWVTVGTGDGMYVQVDPTDSRWLYTTSQFGDHTRVDQVRRVRTRIQPTRPGDQPPLRFNWVAPIHLSPHNSRIVYAGAQVLFRSLNQGDTWQEISPDLTRNDPAKIAGRGNITYCTITTIAESPVTPGLIWVGTDDGKVQVTRNGGASWTDVTPNLVAAGAPDERWVSRVFASPHDAATAFVAKTGYRHDDFRPYLYKTTDYGATWTSIAADLPDRPVNVVVQDRRNPNLLFVGTDGGVHVSLDGGRHWMPLKNNMPTVPVHDLLVHPREQDLVVGTYGRGIWVTNIAPLQELTPAVLERAVHLFDVRPVAWKMASGWGNYQLYGDRHLSTPNEPNGFVVSYYLRAPVPASPTITIADPFGTVLHTMEGPTAAGLHRLVWEPRRPVPEGLYVVTLAGAGTTQTKRTTVRWVYMTPSP